jgi:ketol-acid reductoisomerase
MNFGGVEENVVTREEFPLEKAREVLKDEVIAVIGYGVQGPGQSLNLRDNGFNVIVGQRPGKTYDKAVADGWVPGETLFGIEEACEKATIIQVLLSDPMLADDQETPDCGQGALFLSWFRDHLQRSYAHRAAG